MIRLLVCDDHEIVRDGIRLVSSETDDIKVIDEAATALDSLEKAVNGNYDVILLDISFPDRSGLDVLKDLLIQRPNAKVLILSMHPEDQYAIRALKTGAYGYLTKSSASRELTTAIRKVAGGNKYITLSIAERIASVLEPGNRRKPHEQLSDREYEVMCLLGTGSTVNEIARILLLSPNSVKTYRTRVQKKMAFKNNADLVRYVIENCSPS